jgi:frataxin-like iron-binding protein CyaY
MIARNLKLLIGLIIIGTIATYIVLVTIPSQLAKRSYEAAKTLGEDFKKAFQFTPQITVNNTIVLNQQTPVMELAVLSQNFEHRYQWTNTWLKSKKQIDITGTFEAKAGFNLDNNVSITLTDDQAVVHLPQPTILSVESQGDIVYRDADGFWNWVNPEDRSNATNAFIQDARRFSEQATFVQDAKIKIEEKLREILKPYAKEVVIVYDDTPSLKMNR